MKTFEVAHLPLNGISPLKPYLASIGKLPRAIQIKPSGSNRTRTRGLLSARQARS